MTLAPEGCDRHKKFIPGCEECFAPQAPEKKSWPHRMAIVKWPDSKGYYQAAIKRYPVGDNEVEYLSLEEAEAMAREREGKARADALVEAASFLRRFTQEVKVANEIYEELMNRVQQLRASGNGGK